MSSVAKFAFWVGLVSAMISIFSFATGIASLPSQTSVTQIVRGGAVATNPMPPPEDTQTSQHDKPESTIALFLRIFGRITKLVVVFCAPMLPFISLGVISNPYQMYMDLNFDISGWPVKIANVVERFAEHFPVFWVLIRVLSYIVPAIALFISFFPSSKASAYMLIFLNYFDK